MVRYWQKILKKRIKMSSSRSFMTLKKLAAHLKAFKMKEFDSISIFSVPSCDSWRIKVVSILQAFGILLSVFSPSIIPFRISACLLILSVVAQVPWKILPKEDELVWERRGVNDLLNMQL